jgi:hypothetical protein
MAAFLDLLQQLLDSQLFVATILRTPVDLGTRTDTHAGSEDAYYG